MAVAVVVVVVVVVAVVVVAVAVVVVVGGSSSVGWASRRRGTVVRGCASFATCAAFLFPDVRCSIFG